MSFSSGSGGLGVMERPSSPPDPEVDSRSAGSALGPDTGAEEGDEGASGLPPVKHKWSCDNAL